jgi:hypothetical protein
VREVAPDLPLDRRGLLEDVGGGQADADDGARGLEYPTGRNDHDGQDRDRYDHLDERETEPLHDAAATVARQMTAAGTTAFWQDHEKWGQSPYFRVRIWSGPRLHAAEIG